MTTEDWFKNDELPLKLAEALQNPIVVQALNLLKDTSMAKILNGQALLTITNTRECFGYDVGRASIFRDLENLATPVTKQTQQLKPNYGNTRDTTTDKKAS